MSAGFDAATFKGSLAQNLNFTYLLLRVPISPEALVAISDAYKPFMKVTEVKNSKSIVRLYHKKNNIPLQVVSSRCSEGSAVQFT